MRVLIIDTDLMMGRALRRAMRAKRVDVEHTSDAESGLIDSRDVLVRVWTPEAIDWTQSLRARGLSTPVLLYSTRERPRVERVRAFENGVDQVMVVDPLDAIEEVVEEVVACLAALDRRASGTSVLVRRVGVIEVDLATRAVRVRRRDVRLTKNEYAVLAMICARSPFLVPKHDLNRCLGYTAATASKALKTTFARVRRKLGVAARQVRAVPGAGYWLAP